MYSHHHEIDQEQVHRRVATFFADADGGTVQSCRPASRAAIALATPQSAVTMAVPVDSNLDAELCDQRFHERHDRLSPVWRGVPYGVGDAQPEAPA